MVHVRAGRISTVVLVVLATSVLSAGPSSADEGPSCRRGRGGDCTEQCGDGVASTPGRRAAPGSNQEDQGRSLRQGRELSDDATQDDDGVAGVGDDCLPPVVVPEAPMAVLLPASAVGVVALVLARRRRSLQRHFVA